MLFKKTFSFKKIIATHRLFKIMYKTNITNNLDLSLEVQFFKLGAGIEELKAFI